MLFIDASSREVRRVTVCFMTGVPLTAWTVPAAPYGWGSALDTRGTVSDFDDIGDWHSASGGRICWCAIPVERLRTYQGDFRHLNSGPKRVRKDGRPFTQRKRQMSPATACLSPHAAGRSAIRISGARCSTHRPRPGAI